MPSSSMYQEFNLSPTTLSQAQDIVARADADAAAADAAKVVAQVAANAAAVSAALALSAATVGPTGPTGPAGPTGPTGPQGPTGADGAPGTGTTTYNITGGNPVFETYADARAAITAGTLAAGVKSFWTSGFHTAGDNGGSFYVDIGSVDLVDDPALFTAPTSLLTVGEPAYIHDTINGRYFLMTPKNGEVWVEQFGATAPGYQTRGADLTLYLYKAQRYCIKTNFYTKQWGTRTVRIGPGFWYMGSTFNVKGVPLHIKGCGALTYLQPEVDVSGIHICFQWSFDGNAVNGWHAGTNYDWIKTVSNGTVRRGRLSCNGNVYELITTGISASSGTGPSGTGTDIVDGTAHWKYIRPLLPDEDYNATVDGSGAIVEDLQFYSFWNRATDTYGTACGVLGTARGTVRNVVSDNMSGHGVAFIANGDESFPFAAGNCNGWRIENVTCYYNGWSGVRVGHSNGNAGHGIGIDVSSNGWYGVDDDTFLIATWSDVQSAYDGRPDYGVKQHAGQVSHNGRWWTARLPIGGYEGTPNYQEEPGTGSWWILYGGDGTWGPTTNFPAWSNTDIYETGGGYAGHDLNSRSVWTGVYIEGGTMPSQFGVNMLVLGILGADDGIAIPVQGLILRDGTWAGGRSAIGISNSAARLDGTYKTAAAQFGPNNQPLDLGLLRMQDWDTNSLAWAGHSSDGLTHLDYALKNGSVTIWDLLGANTAKTFGGSQPLPGLLQLPRFILGDDTNGMPFDTGVAPPTSGYFAPGHRRFNKLYVPGGPSEWVCPAGGSPGTWYALVPSNAVSNSYNFFNPSDAGAGIILSAGNLTAKAPGSGFFSVRAANPWTSGKHYAEFTLDAIGSGGVFLSIGLANSSEALNNYTGTDASATVLYNTNGSDTTAEVKRNGSVLASRAKLSAGQVIGVAFDATAQLVWFTVNGTLIAGDPVAGTGGATAPYASAYPIFGADNNVSQVTANFGGSAWAHTPPTGYS